MPKMIANHHHFALQSTQPINSPATMAPPTFDTELMLHFNGKEESVTVNKSALAGVSSYFRNLFLGNWSERAEDDERKRFIIKEEDDFDMNAFTMMLNSLMTLENYLDGGSVEAQTALTILLLSVKYDVPMMQLLNSLNNYSKLELLEVGDALGCWQLKYHCLATLTNHDVLNNYSHNSEVICRLTKRTRELLDERMIELDIEQKTKIATIRGLLTRLQARYA